MEPQKSIQATPSAAKFLTLPVELRLHIAEYAFEQDPAAGIPHKDHQHQDNSPSGWWSEYEHDYRPSENLSLLLVCRQFNTEFTQIAYNKTRFTLRGRSNVIRLHELPALKIRSIRKLAFIPHLSELCSWGSYPFKVEQLRLDELVFLWLGRTPLHGSLQTCNNSLYPIMRDLLHVKTIKFFLYGESEKDNRKAYCRLIATLMKDDHFYIYDAPSAPKIEATWWDWHLNEEGNVMTFQAHPQRPVLPEEDYMLLVKPKVDALMAEAERLADL